MDIDNGHAYAVLSVQIRDGYTESDAVLQRYCSSTLPAPLSTSGPYAWLRFHTDASASDQGFHITFSQIPGKQRRGSTLPSHRYQASRGGGPHHLLTDTRQAVAGVHITYSQIPGKQRQGPHHLLTDTRQAAAGSTSPTHRYQASRGGVHITYSQIPGKPRRGPHHLLTDTRQAAVGVHTSPTHRYQASRGGSSSPTHRYQASSGGQGVVQHGFKVRQGDSSRFC